MSTKNNTNAMLCDSRDSFPPTFWWERDLKCDQLMKVLCNSTFAWEEPSWYSGIHVGTSVLKNRKLMASNSNRGGHGRVWWVGRQMTSNSEWGVGMVKLEMYIALWDILSMFVLEVSHVAQIIVLYISRSWKYTKGYNRSTTPKIKIKDQSILNKLWG